MQSVTQKKRERGNRTKARVASTVLMLLLLILIVFPFMSLSVLDSELARKKQRKQIVVNFAKEKVQKFEETRSQLSQAPPITSNPMSAIPSASPPPAPAPTPAPTPTPEPVAKPTPAKAATPTPSALPTAASKPVLTTPSLKMPSLPKFFKSKAKVKPAAKPVEASLPDEETGEEEIEIGETGGGGADTEPAEKTGTGTDAEATSDSGKGVGDEDGGSTSNPSDGVAGEGQHPSAVPFGLGEGEGEGEFGAFGRKRIYAPKSSALANADGKITLKICVNQDGRVIYAKAQEKGTTIYNDELIAMSEILLKKYKFEKDYNAPERQCGKYAFIAH